MKMTKDGQEALVDKEQVELMLESGWSKIIPLGMKAPVEDEVIDDEVIDDEVIDGEPEVAGEVADEATPSVPRTIPRKKK
jgi:hypothetical protein